MTIDKIKHHINPIIFEFWTNCKDVEIIRRAKNRLKYEIDNNLLSGVEYHAELKLLNYLLF